MNAEALAHASKAARAASQLALQDADRADCLMHRCPNAGTGMKREADVLRDRAIGLAVASTFLARCAKRPNLADLLAALEGGAHVYVVEGVDPTSVIIGRNADPAPPRRPLVARVLALLGHDPGRRDREERAA